MKITFKIISWFTILSGLFLCLYVGYLLTYPFKIADVKLPMPVLNKNNISPNGTIVLEIGYTRYIDGVAKIFSHFNCDSGIYSLEDRTSFVPKGMGLVIRRIPVPSIIPSKDLCVYEAINQYKINPVRIIDLKVWSEQFEIK